MTATVTNASATPQSASLTAQPDATLFVLANSCTASTGACTVDTINNRVVWAGTLAAGETVTIRYRAQVSDDLLPGVRVCVTSTATVGASVTGNITACGTITCPAVGPGSPYPAASEVSDQKAGSVLFFNYYTSDVSSPAVNTRLSLTNTNPSLPIAVHLFFVDGATCSVADAFLCLMQNQTVSFLASDYDPGTSGYVVRHYV